LRRGGKQTRICKVPEEEFDFLGRVSIQLRTIRRAALARLTTFERALLWRWCIGVTVVYAGLFALLAILVLATHASLGRRFSIAPMMEWTESAGSSMTWRRACAKSAHLRSLFLLLSF
jgi:hypothetical protein